MNNKGFTLAELFIIVGVIGVLVSATAVAVVIMKDKNETSKVEDTEEKAIVEEKVEEEPSKDEKIEVEPQPEPTPEPTPEPQPTPEPTPEPTPDPTPAPEPEPTPDPTPEPEPEPEEVTAVEPVSLELFNSEN